MLHKFAHPKSIENTNIHRLWSVFSVTPHLNYFFSLSLSTYLALYQYSPCHCTEQSVLFYAVSILIVNGLRLSGIQRSNYLKTNNLVRKSCPVSGIERIRYSGCFITLKIEGGNSGPTKSSGFVGIPALRGSGLEGFYCKLILHIHIYAFAL